jgi:hypothetical protein
MTYWDTLAAEIAIEHTFDIVYEHHFLISMWNDYDIRYRERCVEVATRIHEMIAKAKENMAYIGITRSHIIDQLDLIDKYAGGILEKLNHAD